MRVLGNLPIIKELAAKFPFGATIQNETDVQDGTPVVREIYGDILMNLYRILGLTNTTPNGIEDSTDTQFQLVEALKKLPNDINDYERVLELNAGVWEVDLDLSILPNKFIFFAKATDSYNSSANYDFKGTGSLTIPFFSTGYNFNDLVLVVVDTTFVVAYNMNFSSPKNIFTPFGNPISYNSTTQVTYQEAGTIMTDIPSVYDLENLIRVDQSDGTLFVKDIVITSGFVICTVTKPSDSTYYKVFGFESPDMVTVYEIGELGGSIIGTEDPYLFVEASSFYFSNNGGSSANDYVLAKYIFNSATKTLTYSSTITLESSFVKTTNTVVKNPNIFTLVSGDLEQFSLVTPTKVDRGNFGGVSGQLFAHGGDVYYGSGEIATKWTL